MSIPAEKLRGKQAADVIEHLDLRIFIDTVFGQPIQVTKWQARSFLVDLGQKQVVMYPISGGGLLITRK